jgi:heptosyltransferase II
MGAMANPADQPSLLVVGPAWVGDMVMAQSLFKLLARRSPAPAIDVLAPGWSVALLQRMPEVRAALELPLAHGELGLRKRWRIGRALRAARYDQAIVLPNSFKSALPPWFARIPRRTGWRGEMRHGLLNDVRRLDPARLPLMVQRFAALAGDGDDVPDEIPRPRLHSDPLQRVQLRERFGLDTQRPVLALCPGAEFGASKRWPATHFATVASAMIDAGWQVWLFGSAADRATTASIAAAQRAHCSDLAGRTSLGEAVDLLACSSAVLSNDSGLMHVAAALGRPVVVVYGGSSPRFTPPLSDDAVTLLPTIACAPCFARECRYGHYRCLQQQSPETVLAALRPLIARGPAP